MLRTIVVVLAIGATATTASAKGALIPPMEIDYGASVPIGAAPALTGHSTEVLVGLHWASLAWFPTRFDIGIGYVGSFRDVVPGYSSAGWSERRTGPAPLASELALDGCYLQLGYTIAGGRHWRTWLAGRGELMAGELGGHQFSALGEALRVATELYVFGNAHDPKSLIIGTFALGIYVEASHRELAPELGPTGVTTGLTLRVPFIFAS